MDTNYISLINKFLSMVVLSEEIILELSQRAAITESFNTEIIWAFGPEWTGDLQMWCQPRWTADHSALFGYTKKSHAPTLKYG